MTQFESPLDCKEIKPVNPKGNQLWIFIGSSEVPILWPPDAKSWLIGKDPDAGKDGHQKEKKGGRRWDGWMGSSNGDEFEQTLGDGKGQGGQARCSPCSRKESDMTKWLNDNNLQGPYLRWDETEGRKNFPRRDLTLGVTLTNYSLTNIYLPSTKQ